MKMRPALIVLCLGILASDGRGAQNDVIRVNTRLVEVGVVVRDKNGPIAGLTKDDFTLLDNGKPQRVEVFSVSTAERSRQKPDKPPLPAGVVSNRNGEQAPASATVILFDRLNTADKYQRDGLKQLLSYLRTARPEDLTALYVLGYDLKLIQDFTGDNERLVRAASKMEVGDLPGVDNGTVQEIAQSQSVGRVTRRNVRLAAAEADYSLAERIDPTEDAIQAIVRHLGTLPGRKSLIWMSAQIPLSINPGSSRDGKDSQLGHATRLLTDANIAVYPVDSHGLLAPDPPRGRRPRSEANLPPDAMVRIANDTGGKAFYFNNDLAGSVRSAIADAEVSYMLGFYPSENGFDGKFHNLQVKVARSDVEVRHRAGYLALKDQGPSEQERKNIVTELLSSPLDASQIGLEAAATAVPGKASTYHVVLRIDPADIHFDRRDDHWTAAVDLVVHLESSKQKTAQLHTFAIDLTEDRFRASLLQGLVIDETVTTSRPDDRLRLVLQDRATGSAGSLSLALNK
ncbi:MAG TPA: VWA domain-containing protein [Terriglobia bacterium]|nr:VWA domain-containing protein [Terriglobia bacterium]